MGSKIWSYKLTDRNATTFFGLSPEDLPKFFPVHFKDVCHCWGGCYLDFWRVPQRGGVNWGVLPSGGDSQCPSFPHPSFEILLQWGSPPYPKGLPQARPSPQARCQPPSCWRCSGSPPANSFRHTPIMSAAWSTCRGVPDDFNLPLFIFHLIWNSFGLVAPTSPLVQAPGLPNPVPPLITRF